MVRAFRSKRTSIAILSLVSSLGLVGCGGGTVQEALGYEQRGPDEMAVIRRPPLIVPPDYNLRPPRPGEADAGSEAASEAARKTLIGPSSEADIEADDARAILTGSTPENGAAADGAGSDGQNVLVSRTDRTERDLDQLTATRAETRVDRSLLRRLLAWTPEDRPDPEEGEEEETADPVVVTVVSRSQTVLEPEGDTEP
ncbi:MAG: DUF3035 domain-containing protein [Geminicoccaceae bacterium]